MTFVSFQQVRFAHVDAAGIVFYPRYFEMLNAAVEDYFEQRHGVSFKEMHLQRRVGVPTVKVDVTFEAASKLGDDLEFNLSPMKTGRSSVEFSVQVLCAGEQRLSGTVIIVCTDLDRMRSLPWPDDLRPHPDT
ncbi:acyl-CoA thioesterase [Porphyrobacter algicida]|uniref:Acyl-CoA thioesterase n=1 Tax=Qipengyuania algicida TaxID=1836209 RepID=A0A845AGB5_9SPHN|nr:thioesterase family protein [Qipengyuania algicida]MXP29280.1 acyl-CoA thioesterase [Qipengyuania algicida]